MGPVIGNVSTGGTRERGNKRKIGMSSGQVELGNVGALESQVTVAGVYVWFGHDRRSRAPAITGISALPKWQTMSCSSCADGNEILKKARQPDLRT